MANSYIEIGMMIFYLSTCPSLLATAAADADGTYSIDCTWLSRQLCTLVKLRDSHLASEHNSIEAQHERRLQTVSQFSEGVYILPLHCKPIERLQSAIVSQANSHAGLECLHLVVKAGRYFDRVAEQLDGSRPQFNRASTRTPANSDRR